MRIAIGVLVTLSGFLAVLTLYAYWNPGHHMIPAKVYWVAGGASFMCLAAAVAIGFFAFKSQRSYR